MAPKIEATYDAETDQVTVNVTDEYTLDIIAIGEDLGDGNYQNVKKVNRDGMAGLSSSYQYVFDVSAFEGDVAYFEARDRAFNTSSVYINITETNTVVEEPKPSRNGGNTSVGPVVDPAPVQPQPDVPTPVEPGKSVVKVEVGENGEVVADVQVSVETPITKVEVPVDLGEENGTVFVEITNEDGTTKKVMALYVDGVLTVKLEDNAKVKILNEVTPLKEAPAFEDTSEHWAKDDIEKVAQLGIFNGKSDTNFGAEDNMTREQMWMVLSRLQGEGQATMEDAKSWAEANGVSDGSNPQGDVTREQLVTLLWRASGEPKTSFDLGKYNDFDGISDWAKEAFAWAVEIGLVNGTSATTLSPQGTATRAQLAAILARLIY